MQATCMHVCTGTQLMCKVMVFDSCHTTILSGRHIFIAYSKCYMYIKNVNVHVKNFN